MTVYVDKPVHRLGRMIMCHCWADTPAELFEMIDRIGVSRRWVQFPPDASWVHFDISKGKRKSAVYFGAVESTTRAALEARRLQAVDPELWGNIGAYLT